MSGRPLAEYIRDTTGVIISINHEHLSHPSPAHLDQSPLIQKTGLSLPTSSIQSLLTLQITVKNAPLQNTKLALAMVASELLELEDIYQVTLLNPAVFGAFSESRDRWIYTVDLWDRRLFKKGAQQALLAVQAAIRGLVAAYRTASADKIVKARSFIEGIHWNIEPNRILAIHHEARTFYQLGRQFEDVSKHDEARLMFKRAILSIQHLYFESDHFIHPGSHQIPSKT